ncbi:MAG: tetratricopeptide repeat protein, partial [Prochlorococcaceae cyanobacterium]
MSAVDVDGLLAHIQTAESQHRWIDAAVGYSDLLVFAPENDRLYSNRGNALWLADLPEQAEASYQAALALAPHCHVAWRGLGNCLRDLQRFEDAVEAYERSIVLDVERRGGMPDPGIVWACGQARLGLE